MHCAQKHSLFIRAIGNTIVLAPPLIISKQEINLLFERLSDAIKDWKNRINKFPNLNFKSTNFNHQIDSILKISQLFVNLRTYKGYPLARNNRSSADFSCLYSYHSSSFDQLCRIWWRANHGSSIHNIVWPCGRNCDHDAVLSFEFVTSCLK